MVTREPLQKELIKRMAKDKEFLKSCNLMDYSLLIVFFRRVGEFSYEENDHSCLSHEDNGQHGKNQMMNKNQLFERAERDEEEKIKEAYEEERN